VREAVDRLLPVASIGGGVLGVRLLRWRGIAAAPAGASVIVEIVLTLIALYVFTALGLVLLVELSAADQEYRRVLLAFLFTLPVPAIAVVLLRYGAVFDRLEKILRPLVGDGFLTAAGAASLDQELRASLRRRRTLLVDGSLQLSAIMCGSFEVWFALRLFGHPVNAGAALILESMTQAMRHLAFLIPAGLGVQEGALVIFGHALGISIELALSVSMAKRIREVLCGLPSLMSWQWLEGRRLRKLA
jgi:putative membrane protein